MLYEPSPEICDVVAYCKAKLSLPQSYAEYYASGQLRFDVRKRHRLEMLICMDDDLCSPWETTAPLRVAAHGILYEEHVVETFHKSATTFTARHELRDGPDMESIVLKDVATRKNFMLEVCGISATEFACVPATIPAVPGLAFLWLANHASDFKPPMSALMVSALIIAVHKSCAPHAEPDTPQRGSARPWRKGVDQWYVSRSMKLILIL